MKSLIKLPLLTVALFCSLSLLWGCGATWHQDFDVIGFGKDGQNVIPIMANGTDYELHPGDKLEFQNVNELDPNAYIKLGGPTCMYLTNYLGITGYVLVRAGYYPLADNPDGSEKYSSAYHNYAKLMTHYQLRITKDGTTQTIDIPYGEDGGILIKDIGSYQFRANPQTTYSAKSISTSLTFAHGFDRTICFEYQKFAKFEVGENQATNTPIDTPPVPPANTPDPIVPLTPTDSTNTGGSTLPGGPSTGTTAAAPTDQKGGGGGGCPLQLATGSSTSSTAWVWLAAIGVTGWIAGRRMKIRTR